MSTIEGGMICTNNKEVYNIASSMRAWANQENATIKVRKKNSKQV